MLDFLYTGGLVGAAALARPVHPARHQRRQRAELVAVDRLPGVTARLLLFRFFLKQVHYQRHMQEMQPQMQEIREKYKSDRPRCSGR